MTGFSLQATVLMNMFHMIESGALSTPIFDPQANPNVADNRMFLRAHVAKLIASAFPHLLR